MANEQVTARILDRDYRLSCSTEEKPALMAAVERVHREMQDIRAQGKVASAERIAVLAALNLASALLASPSPSASAPKESRKASEVRVADPEIARRMRSIDALLDDALGRQEPLF